MRQLGATRLGRIAATVLTSAAIATSLGSGAQAGEANPILDEGQTVVSLSEQDMAEVRGSGYYSRLYSYYAIYYTGIALQNAYYAGYYDLGGQNSTAQSYYSTAAQNAYYAYQWWQSASQYTTSQ